MQCESHLSDPYDNMNHIDMSPVADTKLFSKSVWFIHRHKKSYNTGNSKKLRHSEFPSKRWGHSSLIHEKEMLIFGGRHSHRSLSNLFAFDLQQYIWSKVDPPSQTPPARDSHSAILYGNEMIIFAGSGSGRKLNDLWKMNLASRKWSRLNATGLYPKPREGHSAALVNKDYMIIYGGLDEDESNLNDIYLLDLRVYVWRTMEVFGDIPSLRDSLSCTMLNDVCYLFGGQGEEDTLFNELYKLTFEISEKDNLYRAIFEFQNITGKKPCPRTSHACIAYKSQYLIVIGGETSSDTNVNKPLNDVWIFNLETSEWNEIKPANSDAFDSRLCHSASLFEDKIFIYGGMKNADNTINNMAVMCLDGDTKELEASKSKLTLGIENYDGIGMAAALSKNNEKLKHLTDKENDYIYVTNNINVLSNNNTQMKSNFGTREVAVDTSELYEDNSFDFENLKRNYLNNLISWNFLKRLAELFQWPLGCLGNFIENSLKPEVKSQNIFIDVKCYNQKVYTNEKLSSLNLKDCNDFNDKKIVLSIKDDGSGISAKEFNEIMYSFSLNQNKELSFFKFGVSMKASAIRLAQSFLLLTKTDKELSFGLISKNLQTKLDTDFILTPIVNYLIDDGQEVNSGEGHKIKYVPKNNFARQSFKLILNEILFMFRSSEDIFSYFDSMQRGTHLFLFDLKQLSGRRADLNQLKNYELFFDIENNDILYNYFDIQIGEKSLIDCSLKTYLKFFNLRHPQSNVYLFGERVCMKNPLFAINNVSKHSNNVTRISTKLKLENKVTSDCFLIEGEIYRGVVFNQQFYKNFLQTSDFNIDMYANEKEIFNGVLLYKDNKLICRFDQNKLGEIAFFVKQYDFMQDDLFFMKTGYIEVPSDCFDLLHSKLEFKDQAMYAYFYSKLKRILENLKIN